MPCYKEWWCIGLVTFLHLLGSGSGENGHEVLMYGLPSLTYNTYGVGTVHNLAYTGRGKGTTQNSLLRSPYVHTSCYSKASGSSVQIGMMPLVRKEVISLQDSNVSTSHL